MMELCSGQFLSSEECDSWLHDTSFNVNYFMHSFFCKEYMIITSFFQYLIYNNFRLPKLSMYLYNCHIQITCPLKKICFKMLVNLLHIVFGMTLSLNCLFILRMNIMVLSLIIFVILSYCITAYSFIWRVIVWNWEWEWP